MSNPQRGEVLVTTEAGEYTLAFTLGAIAAIEGQFPGQGFQSILEELQGDDPKVATMQVVIWAALKRHHKFTLDEVGDMITMADLPAWGEALGRAVQQAAPAEAVPQNPPKAKAN